MTAFFTLAARLLLLALLAAGVGGAIFVAVRARDNGSDSQVAGKLTQTLTVVATTTAPSPTAAEGTPPPGATPEATSPAQPTAPAYTALPEPPPEPSNPPAVTNPLQVDGGSWYEFECIAFYLPAGWSYRLHVTVGGSGPTLGIREQASGSIVVFDQATLELLNRAVYQDSAAQVLDQIADSINRNC